ncbi:hypothetical protein BS78_05G285200 [Paspalum vaginatum]|nr:hypothetical protein BS78_05G285200 [Paspalum vaginatum]
MGCRCAAEGLGKAQVTDGRGGQRKRKTGKTRAGDSKIGYRTSTLEALTRVCSGAEHAPAHQSSVSIRQVNNTSAVVSSSLLRAGLAAQNSVDFPAFSPGRKPTRRLSGGCPSASIIRQRFAQGAHFPLRNNPGLGWPGDSPVLVPSLAPRSSRRSQVRPARDRRRRRASLAPPSAWRSGLPHASVCSSGLPRASIRLELWLPPRRCPPGDPPSPAPPSAWSPCFHRAGATRRSGHPCAFPSLLHPGLSSDLRPSTTPPAGTEGAPPPPWY